MANEKFKDKIIKVFGMEMDEDDNNAYYDDNAAYDDGYYDDVTEPAVEEAPAEPKPRQSFVSRKKTQTSSRPSLGGLGGIGDGPDVLVLEPQRFEDAPGIVNKIKADKTIVVNLKSTEYEEGRKIFDFLNGAVFALEGSINKIEDNVFILAPKQVTVSTTMEPDEDVDMPTIDWD